MSSKIRKGNAPAELNKIVDKDAEKVYVSGPLISKNIKLLRREGLLYDGSSSTWWYPLRYEQKFAQLFARFQNSDNRKAAFLSKFMNERVHCYLLESALVAELLRKDTNEVKEDDALVLLRDIYGCYEPSLRNITSPVRSSVEKWSKELQENFSQGAKNIVARAVTAQTNSLEKLSYEDAVEKVDREREELTRRGLGKYKSADKMFVAAIQKIKGKLGEPTGDLTAAFRTILAVLIVLPLDAKQKFYDETSDILRETRKGEIGPHLTLLLSQGREKAQSAKEKLTERWRQKEFHQAAIELLAEKHTGILLRKPKKGAILSRSAFFSLS
nr:hypothetical protein [Marseillevirus cajuinensis]